MEKVILGMTMSVDGFINDSNGSVSNLYPDLNDLHQSEILQEAIKTTGAVVIGRHAFAMGDPDSYAENYEFQVPIFVLKHQIPIKHPKEDGNLTFTFVTDGIESAIQKAKAAAGDKDVTVIGGADTAQQCLNAGLVDELQVGVMPVILGKGLRFFEHLGAGKIELEKTRVMEFGARTDLIFQVKK